MHFRNASAAAGLIAAAVLLPHEPAAQSPTEATTSTQTVAEATTPSMMVVTPQTGGSMVYLTNAAVPEVAIDLLAPLTAVHGDETLLDASEHPAMWRNALEPGATSAMWRESQPLLINPVCVPDERGVTLLFNLKNRIRKPEVIDMLELTSVLFVRTPAMDDDQATTTANPFEDPRLERTYAIVDGGLVPWNERPEGAIQGVAIESAWLDRTLMVSGRSLEIESASPMSGLRFKLVFPTIKPQQFLRDSVRISLMEGGATEALNDLWTPEANVVRLPPPREGEPIRYMDAQELQRRIEERQRRYEDESQQRDPNAAGDLTEIKGRDGESPTNKGRTKGAGTEP